MDLEWVPETYPPSGGLAATGFYKLLGRPRLDPLTVLVRETAQNSWDARQSDRLPVTFNIDGWDLDPSEQKALKKSVFPDAAKVKGSGLAGALSGSSLAGIYITDRNTKGLGGPLRADEADSDGVYDWVDFVLNVGKANTAGHTGGTYGFGKTISYIVSGVKTVVIHSRTLHKGRIQSRLIACAIGEEFIQRSRLCTGRHWWGRSKDGDPLPLTGAAADRLAHEIGMPAFDDDDLGTNLLVVAPDFGGRTPEQAMNFIAESVTWHLWPKLMRRTRSTPMEIAVSWNGTELDIPDPADRPPLHGFAQAFQAMLDEDDPENQPAGTRHELIWCQRPKTVVGELVTVPLVHRDRVPVDDGHDPDDPESPDAAAVITDVSHHIALLRSPELVVDYLRGPAPPEGGTEWAGVFRCRPEHDANFAAAEPPTHDSWSPELLPRGPGRTVVKVGLREVRRALDSRWAPLPPEEDRRTSSTALVADQLAHLVRTTQGQGKGRKGSGGGGSSTSQRGPQVSIVESGPIRHGSSIATMAKVTVKHRPGSAGTVLHISCGAALDGAASDPGLDPQLRLVEASYLGTRSALDSVTAAIELVGQDDVAVEIVVARGAATTVLFDLVVEAIDAG